MFFTLQKLFWFIIMPPSCIILLMILGVATARRRKGPGMLLIMTGILLLYLLSLSPVASILLAPLEGPFPPLQEVPGKVDAVVVPGGGSVNLSRFGAVPIPNSESYTRLIKGVELAKRLNCPLILTGGNGEPFATNLSDADVMAATAYAMGMPRNRVIVENHSRNTVENALEVRKIFTGNRIILATSAYYLRRATAIFKRQGFQVTPAPVYYFGEPEAFRLSMLIPQAGALEASKVALAEWVSMVWWRVRGEM